MGVADEANLGKNGGHIRADEHHERRLLDPAIDSGAFSRGKRSIDVLRQFARLIDLVAQHDLLDEVLQLMNGTLAGRIFARRRFKGFT